MHLFLSYSNAFSFQGVDVSSTLANCMADNALLLRPWRADAQGIECCVLDSGLKLVEISSRQLLPIFFTFQSVGG